MRRARAASRRLEVKPAPYVALEVIMEVVALTAFGVGGATVIGGAIGFIFRKYLINFRTQFFPLRQV